MAGVVVGVLTFVFPGLTAIILVHFIAARALVVGVVEIAAAVALRREASNEWLLILRGIFAILFGLILLIAPGAGALAMVLMIGVYAIIAGVLLLLVAFRPKLGQERVERLTWWHVRCLVQGERVWPE